MKTITKSTGKYALAIIAGILLNVTHAQVQGPNFGKSSVVIANHSQTWQNVSNVFFEDNSYTSVSLSKGDVSDTMEINNFHFNLPSDVIIDGITVTIKKGAGNGSISDNMVKLICNGKVCGTNHASSEEWPLAAKTFSYGGENDKWGLTLSPAMVNSFAFGVAINVSNSVFSTDSATANIDYINITLNYRKPESLGLTDFTAYFDENQVALDWTMETQKGCIGFTIERSVDGVTPEVAGTVSGNMNTDSAINYSFTDNSPLSGTSYYRIEERDNDGSVKDYNWIAVSSAERVSTVKVFPNPTGDWLTVKFPSIGQSAMLMMLDASGRIVINESVATFANEDNTTHIEDVSSLSQGVYTVLVNNGFNNYTDKFIKK
jgi:hypothetical protein